MLKVLQVQCEAGTQEVLHRSCVQRPPVFDIRATERDEGVVCPRVSPPPWFSRASASWLGAEREIFCVKRT